MKSQATPRTRTPAPRDTERAELAIDFDRYVPTVLSRLVAKFRANANAFFPKAYGVSLAEWRILSFLHEHAPASAYVEGVQRYVAKLPKTKPVKASSNGRTGEPFKALAQQIASDLAGD